jgi:hypothetical protein
MILVQDPAADLDAQLVGVVMGHLRGMRLRARPGQQHPILQARRRPREGRETASLATLRRRIACMAAD